MANPSHKDKAKSNTPSWRPTTVMIMRDLSRDDDFLSAMLVESLGTEDTPLTVHKMDPSRRVPAFDPAEVLAIVRRHVVLSQPDRGGAGAASNRVRHAVDALLQLQAVKTYLRGKNERQRNAFATHASRYFELYLPNGSVEIAHTTRYRHKTGKSELCIIATKPLAVGTVITDLKGSLADLTPEEDEALRRKDTRHSLGIRRDFSVIYSRQRNTSHLFLGPARFVNHDCEHNVQLFRDGRYITFRVIKPIEQGQEITAHYGNSYFGRKNKDCLCETCEKKGKGGYAPREEGVDDVSESDISESSEIDRTRRFWDAAEEEGKLNLHVRKTRRGTYALDKRATTSATPAASGTPAVASTSATPAIASTPATPAVASTSATPAVASTPATGSSATPVGASTPADIIEVEMELEVEPEKVADAVNVTPAVSVLSELPTLSSLSSSPSEMPTRAPTPEPVPDPVRAVTPTVDIPSPPSPGPYEPIDLDAYKPDALTAHFPPGLVRLTNPETIARLVLRRDDMNARASTRGLPHPSLHPLLAAAENYPKFPATAEPTHFVVSAALVDPHHTTFDFFDCGRLAFPHDLVELDVKQKICEMVLLRQDLGRRSDWRGLPWPEWCPALLNPAIKAGRYPKFPPVEKRGEPPRFFASRALVEAWWGVPHALESPLPVGSDVPAQQLTFLTDVEWEHIRVEPELYGLTHESTWEGLPWPETAPALLAAAKAKRYPVFPEIDDRGAPPGMRPDRTYAVFERAIKRVTSTPAFAHTFEGYKAAWRRDALPRTFEVPRAAWARIREAPEEFGLNARSDWRGLPWPETAPALVDAQQKGRYPAFPPLHLRGAQPRSTADGARFVVFDRAFAAPEPGAAGLESEVETGSATTTARASTAPTSVGTPSPKKKGKGKDKEVLRPVVEKPLDDGVPRCLNPTCKKELVAGGNGVMGAGGILGGTVGTECHRCRRHILIYGSAWPKRTPPPGAWLRSPTPSSSEEESEVEEEPAPPPPVLLKGKKRPAPTPTPTSTPQPPAKKRRDERMEARNKARDEAERAEMDRVTMQRAMKRYREAMREEEERYRAAKRARWEDEHRPPPRLATIPTPTFYARKREEEIQDQLMQDEPPAQRKVSWRMPKRLGGLGGALNPLYFARRRALAAQQPSDDDDSTKVDEAEEPSSSSPSSPMPPPIPLHRSRPLPPMPIIRIPVPPWMEDAGADGDDEMPTLVVEVVA